MNLNENFINDIPDALARAPRLRVLRLQNNQLTLNSIPESLLAESQVRNGVPQHFKKTQIHMLNLQKNTPFFYLYR